MRASVAIAVGVLSVIGFSAAEEVLAGIRKSTNIPAQGLGPALQTLAKERGFQIIYIAGEVDALRTQGAAGELTAEEALTQILQGTGLSYRPFGEQAVGIVAIAASSSSSEAFPGKQISSRLNEGLSFRIAQASSAPQADLDTGKASAGGAVPEGTLEELVVTAQKREERLQDVPISISVLSGAALDKQSSGVAEALSQVAGVSLSASGMAGGGQVTIRGVSANFPLLGGSSTSAYYIDAIPFGFVKSAIAPDSSAYDMERIEVLRGPQGTLYGASALNGVVRLLTTDPDLEKLEFKGRANLSNTERGDPSYGGDVAVNVPLLQDKLALRVVAGANHIGGWIDQPVLGENNANDGDDSTIRAKLRFDPSEDLSIVLESWNTRTDLNAGNFAEDGDIQPTPSPTPVASSSGVYGAKISYDFAAVSVTSSTGYVDYESNSITPRTGYPAVMLTAGFKSKVLSEELLLNSRLPGSWRWSAGLYYRDAKDALLQDLPGLLPAPLNFEDQSRSYAIFGQITRTFADDHFEASAGLRAFRDRVSQRELAPLTGDPTQALINVTKEFDALTPRAALTWLPTDRFTMYATYAQGFRSGYNQSPLALFAAPSLPVVDADTLNNYEVGAKGALFDGLVSFESAVYYMDWKDIQQNVIVQFNGVGLAAAINGSSATGWGTDLGATIRVLPGWRLGGTLSWNDLALTAPVYSAGAILIPEGARPAFSAKVTGGVFTDYRVDIGTDFTAVLSASANYRSKTAYYGVGAPVVESDEPWIARISLGLEAGERWSARLFVDNASDWDGHLTPPLTPSSDMRQRPRSYGIQFEFHQ